jgi:hypothetical protein
MHIAGVSGCIVRYDFNGANTSNLPDRSGNNHPAGAFNLSSVPGFRNRIGNAMHFDGVSSGARATPDTQFNVSSVTILALVQFSDFYSGSCQGNEIVGRTINHYTPGTWAMHVSDHAYDQDCSVSSPNRQQLVFISPSSGTPSPPAGNYITKNDWYFMAISYNGGTSTAYQVKMDTANMVTSLSPIYTSAYNMPLSSSADSLYIGHTSHWSYRYWFNGDMDDLAIFNKALTTSEIQAVYSYLWQTGLGVNSTSKLDEVKAYIGDNGKLHISNPTTKTAQATLYDMAGRSLCSFQLDHKAVDFDFSQYASGMFLLKLECEGVVATRKLMKL